MTAPVLQIPAVGQPHSTEDVKVGNSLSALQTWANTIDPLVTADTGWLALALASGVLPGPGSYAPAARLQGGVVRLKGSLLNGSGGLIAANSTWATIPTPCRPTVNLLLPMTAFQSSSVWSAAPWSIGTGGAITNQIMGFGVNYAVYLDGMTYTLS